MRFRFTITITADGVPFQAGDETSRDTIPDACFDTLLRMGHIEAIPECTTPVPVEAIQAEQETEEPEPEPEPAPVKVKRTKKQ